MLIQGLKDVMRKINQRFINIDAVVIKERIGGFALPDRSVPDELLNLDIRTYIPSSVCDFGEPGVEVEPVRFGSVFEMSVGGDTGTVPRPGANSTRNLNRWLDIVRKCQKTSPRTLRKKQTVF